MENENRNTGKSKKPSLILRTASRENRAFLFELLLLLSIIILIAVRSGRYVDFVPINGTFQNFNPVRRFLSGQIPYRDFQDYLGLGHLYAGTLMTAVFGGDYHGSLVAFTFLSTFSLAMCSMMAAMAVFRKKETAAALSNVLLLMVLLKPNFFINSISGSDDVTEALNYAVETGNSARFIRGLILPLTVLMLWFAYRSIRKISGKNQYSGEKVILLISVSAGLIAGFAFGWSNDYGICCWVCIAVMVFCLVISRTRNFFSALGALCIEMAASAAGVLIFIEIFTLGNLKEWAAATFGTGGYQSWYYNSYSPSYYVYDVFFSFPALFQAALTVVFLWKLFKARGTDEALAKYGVLAFSNMACFCAVSEYKLLSGGFNREVSLTVLFLTVCCLLIEPVSRLTGTENFRKYLLYGTAAAGLAWCVLAVKEELVFSQYTEKMGIYNEALGGNLTALGEDLVRTDEFLDGEKVFASYASAQEVVSGQFQPSGTDYIIHVLGDKQREKYLGSFNTDDFRYAATIKGAYTDWEYWVNRANWYFYRELYEKWHPVYANSYEVYWERNAEGEENTADTSCRIQLADVNDYTKKIKAECDAPVSGVADVYIDYAVQKKPVLSSRLVFNTDIAVQNTYALSAHKSVYESNHLRPVSAEYIPVPLVNGYGEAEITSNPNLHTVLQVNAVSCERVFTVPADYPEMTGPFVPQTDTAVFTIENTSANSETVRDASAVVYGGEEFPIEDISHDQAGIRITVNGIPSSGSGNIIKIRR